MLKMRLCFHLSAALLFGLSHASLAQNQAAAAPPAVQQPPLPLKPNIPNGISVGRPKVFDNRTLTLMLESLSESLRNMQFVDQKGLAAAFNFQQGSRSNELVTNTSLTTLPIPSLQKETVSTTGNADSTGKPLPDSTKTTTTTKSDAVAPQPPPLDTLPAFSGFNPSFGENPSDLLGDQVNLSYQIFNLRLILERSLSDRLLTTDGATDATRLQAVMGFNVTIDPPRTAVDSVAVVEITLTSKESQAAGLSLVSLMPQEKTYNSSALSTKSNAFGGSAVAKIFQVGYSQRQRSQIFYLYRDTDTVAYERMNSENPNQIVFGWMFRPVLGRRAVSPGLRQLFAIVALPNKDQKVATPDDHDAPPKLDAEVKTYWKKYDSSTLTAFDERDANRATRFQYGLSLTLAKPEIFQERYKNHAYYPNIEVKSTTRYQDDLRPSVSHVWWVPVGSKSALVSATGKNFFSGTQVALGDKVYTGNADGLVLKSNEAFDITATIDALKDGTGAIIGRYGPAVPLVEAEELCTRLVKAEHCHGPGYWGDQLSIANVEIDPSLSGVRSLRVTLKGRTTGLSLKDLPRGLHGYSTPIITVNGSIASPPYTLFEEQDKEPGHVILQANIPDAFLSNGGGVIKVGWPFLPERWTASRRFYDPKSAFQLARLSANRVVLTTLDPLGFTRDHEGHVPAKSYCWHLITGDANSIDLDSDTCHSAGSTSSKVSDHAVSVSIPTGIPDKVVLVDPGGASFLLDVPKLKTSGSDDVKPITLNQYDSVWVDIAVDDVTKVDSVEANQTSPKFRPASPSKTGEPAKAVQVQITQTLTAKPGDVDLTLLDKGGKVINNTRLHIICQMCNERGDKR